MVPLKCIRNFWKTHEMSIIKCEISPQLICSKKGMLAAGTEAIQVPKFRITDTKLCFLVVTLSTQNNIKLLK